MAKRKHPKTGSIFAIPIRDGKEYLFARMFRDGDIEIFSKPSKTKDFDRAIMSDVLYVATTTKNISRLEGVEEVDKVLFASPEEEHSPPRKIVDVISGEFRIEIDGFPHPSTKEETEGLFPASVIRAEYLATRLEEMLGYESTDCDDEPTQTKQCHEAVDTSVFWKTIDIALETSGPEIDLLAESLQDNLNSLSPNEKAGFLAGYYDACQQANTWDIWGAAYLVNGGCSDDGFAYFRNWLIAQGSEVFDKVMASPDDLAAFVDPISVVCEYEELTNSCVDTCEEDARAILGDDCSFPCGDPKGIHWNFDDDEEMKQRYPQLWALASKEND